MPKANRTVAHLSTHARIQLPLCIALLVGILPAGGALAMVFTARSKILEAKMYRRQTLEHLDTLCYIFQDLRRRNCPMSPRAAEYQYQQRILYACTRALVDRIAESLPRVGQPFLERTVIDQPRYNLRMPANVPVQLARVWIVKAACV